MPKTDPRSEQFRRWAERFDHRHRFGIPVTPIPKQEAPVPPTIVALPPRAGSMQFAAEDVAAVIDLLSQCAPGQAVRLTDDPDESDNTARRRSEIMKEQIEKERKGEPIKPGLKIRGHVLTEGEPTVKEKVSKKSKKKYKVTTHPKNWAAVSLVPEGTPDEPPADPEAGDDDNGSANGAGE